MSEENATTTEQRWVRYRHRHTLGIEYDVFSYPLGGPVSEELGNERCFRIRTIRNLSFAEEVHQPAYTLMPAELFFDVYERVT